MASSLECSYLSFSCPNFPNEYKSSFLFLTKKNVHYPVPKASCCLCLLNALGEGMKLSRIGKDIWCPDTDLFPFTLGKEECERKV